LAHKNARSSEEGNLQEILLKTTATDPDIIEALLVLSEHQYETRPRLEVSQHVLKLSKESQHQKLYGEALYWHGLILESISHYEEAIAQLRLARETFIHVSELKRAADALFWVGHLSAYVTGQTNIHNVEDALAESQSLAYPSGIVQCQIQLSSLTDDQSLSTFTNLREFCILNNLPIQQLACTKNLACIYINLGRFDKAKQWGLIALEEAKEPLDDQFQIASTLQIVARACILQGDHHEAVKYLMEGIESSKAYGSPLLIARVLFHLGRAWMKKGQKEDARGAFMESLKYYEMVQGAWQGPATQRACRFYFDKLENPSREPDFEEMNALGELGIDDDYEMAGSPSEPDSEEA
jgi:tetratricopeptide (TPR) repeat protein